ncbi:MAG: hypothetical protein RL524_533 [Actinomycetota bacterium]
MHEFTPEIEKVAQEILEYSLTRLKDNPPLDGPMSESELFARVGNTITEAGLGGSEALQLFTQTLAPACIPNSCTCLYFYRPPTLFGIYPICSIGARQPL